MAVFTQFLLGVCLSLDPIPIQELCLNMGFQILGGLLSILIPQQKQLNLPVVISFLQTTKALEALGAKIGPISKVFWLYAMDVYFFKKLYQIFKEDISRNKWSYKVKVIKRYKMAYHPIFTHLTSQLLIRVTTSLNVIWVLTKLFCF